MEQPPGWTWQDRAEGSIPRGSALDPSVDPVAGIRAFPTAYLPDRLLISERADDENGAYDRDLKILMEAASAFGWRLQVESDDVVRAGRRADTLPGVPG